MQLTFDDGYQAQLPQGYVAEHIWHGIEEAVGKLVAADLPWAMVLVSPDDYRALEQDAVLYSGGAFQPGERLFVTVECHCPDEHPVYIFAHRDIPSGTVLAVPDPVIQPAQAGKH